MHWNMLIVMEEMRTTWTWGQNGWRVLLRYGAKHFIDQKLFSFLTRRFESKLHCNHSHPLFNKYIHLSRALTWQNSFVRAPPTRRTPVPPFDIQGIEYNGPTNRLQSAPLFLWFKIEIHTNCPYHYGEWRERVCHCDPIKIWYSNDSCGWMITLFRWYRVSKIKWLD